MNVVPTDVASSFNYTWDLRSSGILREPLDAWRWNRRFVPNRRWLTTNISWVTSQKSEVQYTCSVSSLLILVWRCMEQYRILTLLSPVVREEKNVIRSNVCRHRFATEICRLRKCTLQ